MGERSGLGAAAKALLVLADVAPVSVIDLRLMDCLAWARTNADID